MDEPKLPEDWRHTWFENSHSEIRWSKEQGWRALEGAAVLLAGVAAASAALPSIPLGVTVALATLVVGFAIFHLVDLHQSTKKARKWCHDLVPNRPGPARAFDSDHLLYLLVQVAVVITAGILSVCVGSIRPAAVASAQPAARQSTQPAGGAGTQTNEHVVDVSGRAIHLPASRWKAMQNEFPWAVNFEDSFKDEGQEVDAVESRSLRTNTWRCSLLDLEP